MHFGCYSNLNMV
jgi:hypothetical protein